MIYVFDACALLAYLKAEPGEDTIRRLIDRAGNGDDSLYMHVYNLLEVCYGFCRELGAEKTAVVKRNISRLPLTIINRVSAPFFNEAVRLKAYYLCSLADAVGIAAAVKLSGQFVTADHHELDAVEKAESFSFLWIR
jgi:predicted nucleic acid-binding protein